MTAVIHRSRTVRALYVALGVISLALGIIGIAVPLMPTTVFILLAGFFFARSSERLHRWLLTNRRFGPMVRDYQAGLGITLRVKVWAVAAVAIAFTITMVTLVTSTPGRLVLGALAIGIAAYIISRPTRQPASEEAG